jgi:hypothetical protein
VKTGRVFLAALFLLARAGQAEAPRRIAIVWDGGGPRGAIGVSDGTLHEASVAQGQGEIGDGGRFSAGPGPFRLELAVSGSERRYGPGTPIVTVEATPHPFSFFLRDVSSDHPILIPAYQVAVTEASDGRSYRELERAVRARGLQSKLERIDSEPEESFENAARHTRRLSCQTWLGLSRDIRIFAVSERLDWIEPRFHGYEVTLPETDNRPLRYNFLVGRGWGATEQINRRLERGILPILRGTLVDDEVSYQLTAFATLESSALTADAVRGTHFLVADGHGRGHMFTEEQEAQYRSLLATEMNPPEETVLMVRIAAVNTAGVPRYAFFKSPAPAGAYDFDGRRGYGLFRSGRVFLVARLDGKPLAQEEVAILLKPGETAELELFLPHRPVPAERAVRLAQVSFDERHEQCRRYWEGKLGKAAGIRLPERRIEEMIRAGLLHLDLITYGREPLGTLTATIGRYSAIGSESSPIIQFFDSMGWHDVARRSLAYFLDKQHEDGFIQNFGGYMLETGAALWSLGEHYRYTRDRDWVGRIAPKLLRSCEFLRRWRARNQREELRGRGYGMLEGKTADPEDPFRSFMLNGYAYLGLSRAAEMLEAVDRAEAERWRGEAEALRRDIRSAVFEGMARSPVVPLAGGTWCPTLAPWAESRGPLLLFADGGKWFTHGSMASRDSLLGPVYLIFQEVLDPREPAAGFLLDFHNDLMTTRNVAFSQPYYSRHPVAHLRRGEVKRFLKAYYNTVASLADRDTYTFWEHFFGASPHKTHEEGWFLMQTRWMLWMENGRTLELLAGAPRAWLENGNRIELRNVASYFGPVSLELVSRLEDGRIEALVECHSDRKPEAVELRLPHPQGRLASRALGGRYDPKTERVRIEPFGGRARVVLEFRDSEAGR